MMQEREGCGQPCSPREQDCAVCVAYWEKMVQLGFWDREREEWTPAAGFYLAFRKFSS